MSARKLLAAACAAAALSGCVNPAAQPASGEPDAGGGGDPDGAPPAPGEVVVLAVPELPGSRLFVREGAAGVPGIVMLHGSEGGSTHFLDEDATRLAEDGSAVLAFCWFGCPGKPAAILRIPLEDTVAAIEWLRASDPVAGGPVGLYGLSRGAEQSVLLASLVRDPAVIAAVAVHAPSDTVVAAYDPETGWSPYETDPRTGEQVFAPAWTWQGEPLYGERDSFSEPGPRIRVEDYPAPMYLSHGTADDLWPVQRSRNIEAARLAAGLPTETHYWRGEGHILEDPAHVEEFLRTLGEFFARLE
jgi:dienelactone hydrolase